MQGDGKLATALIHEMNNGERLSGTERWHVEKGWTTLTPDSDPLRRCFDLVEDIYNIPGERAPGAVYFQVFECLLESRRYLTAAIPFLRGSSRGSVSRMLKNYEVEGYERGLPPL